MLFEFVGWNDLQPLLFDFQMRIVVALHKKFAAVFKDKGEPNHAIGRAGGTEMNPFIQ